MGQNGLKGNKLSQGIVSSMESCVNGYMLNTSRIQSNRSGEETLVLLYILGYLDLNGYWVAQIAGLDETMVFFYYYVLRTPYSLATHDTLIFDPSIKLLNSIFVQMCPGFKHCTRPKCSMFHFCYCNGRKIATVVDPP